MGDSTLPVSSPSAHGEHGILPRGRAPMAGAARVFCNLNEKLRQFWDRCHSQKPLDGFMQGEHPRGGAALQPCPVQETGVQEGSHLFQTLLQDDEQSACLVSWICLFVADESTGWVSLLVREEGSVILCS